MASWLRFRLKPGPQRRQHVSSTHTSVTVQALRKQDWLQLFLLPKAEESQAWAGTGKLTVSRIPWLGNGAFELCFGGHFKRTEHTSECDTITSSSPNMQRFHGFKEVCPWLLSHLSRLPRWWLMSMCAYPHLHIWAFVQICMYYMGMCICPHGRLWGPHPPLGEGPRNS